MKDKKKQKQLVVVAEKNSENCLSLCSLVTSLNFEAIPVYFSLDIIREVKLGHVALVLLDVDLTFLDKENTLHEIRKVAPILPVIMMSSAMTPMLAKRLTDRGAQGFLLKPVQRDHLAMMLFQYLPGQSKPSMPRGDQPEEPGRKNALTQGKRFQKHNH